MPTIRPVRHGLASGRVCDALPSRPDVCRVSAAAVVAVCLLSGAGCDRQADVPVVYCSADEEFARQVFAEFTRQTGLKAEVLFDTEAGKTTGLVRRIEAERAAPRADVFWSSEVFNTVRLAEQGALEAYRPKTAEDIDKRFRCPNDRWTGFGLRGRVVAFNTGKLTRTTAPKQWFELGDPKWSGRLAMANPQFGTTRGHVATMFAMWGQAKATDFLKRLAKHGVRIADGNASAVRMVARGEVDLCMTDTDDVWVAQRRGLPVDMVYPSMGEGSGTLWIPNTVAILSGCRHPTAARRVADFLASAEVERLLAKSHSRNVPVRQALAGTLGTTQPAMTSVDYAASAKAMPAAIECAKKILLR